MRGDVVAVCKDGYAHKYEMIWERDEYPPGRANHRWYVQRCTRCDVHRGMRPNRKYYAINDVAAKHEIMDHYEQWVLDETADALAAI